ncbi:MAG: hypothetical protein AAF610_09795 [Pseudomonadota bacterium]
MSNTDNTETETPNHQPSGRWQAAGVHLGLSILVFLILAALIAGVLFPGALFWSTGGSEGIKLIAGVDLVLGPLLTLIVYNRTKPRGEIIRDLSVIGVIQCAALAAGMFIVYQQRPITVTWANDRFYVATANEYRAADVAQDQMPALKPLSPVFGVIDLPDDPAERATIAMTYAMAGEPLHMRMTLYKPLPEKAETRALLRFNALNADTATECIDVNVVSRFGNFEHCFNPSTRRFK